MIDLVEVRKLYRATSREVAALNGLSFHLSAGEHAAILGKSGCGKTTLLNLLGGLDRATSGKLLVDGQELRNLSDRELANYRRHRVGMVFQSFNLIASRNALQNVELPLIFSGIPRRERQRRAREALDLVDLSDRWDHRPAQLSGGQQQRVAIARALVQRPRLLLADEPTGNLDSRTAAQITELLRAMAKAGDITLVVVTHDEEVAARVASRVIRMKDGRTIDAPPGEKMTLVDKPVSASSGDEAPQTEP